MNFKSYFSKEKYNLSDKEILSIKVGNLITAARIFSGFSQSDLAKRIGTHQPSIARAEKGEVIASIEFLNKIAKAIGTDLILPKFGFMDKTSNQSTQNVDLKYSLEEGVITIRKAQRSPYSIDFSNTNGNYKINTNEGL